MNNKGLCCAAAMRSVATITLATCIIMPDCLILYAGGRGGWCRCLSVPSSSYTTRPGSTSCVTDPAAGLKPKPTTDRCTNTVKFCRHFPDSATWRYPPFSPTVSDIYCALEISRHIVQKCLQRFNKKARSLQKC